MKAAIPILPQHFTMNSSYPIQNNDDTSGVEWHRLYDGQFDGHMNYPNVLKAIQKSYRYKELTPKTVYILGTGWAKCDWAFWNEGDSLNGTTATAGRVVDWSIMEEDPQSTWKLNADDPDTLYYALASAFGGLGAILRAALTGQGTEVSATIGSINPKITISMKGDSLYPTLFEPLYQVLGLPQGTGNGQYLTSSQIGNYMNTTKIGDCYVLANGYQFWQKLLGPIIYWVEHTLFEKPVETILNVLPNLLAMIEFNQVLPKLRNIVINLNGFLGIVNLDLKRNDMINIENVLTEKGIILSNGVSGLLNSLISVKATTTPPSLDDEDVKVLMAKDKDTGEASLTERATYKEQSFCFSLYA